ncbi:MAG: hypothetical protein AB1716_15285 [Planctomycetota bacterium]
MLSWIFSAASILVLASPVQEQPRQEPAQKQPATQSAPGPTTRHAPQHEILRKLIQQRERRTPIAPVSPEQTGSGGRQAERQTDSEGHPLLIDGAVLVERPGRLVYEGGRPVFILHLEGADGRTRKLELLKNQMLEAMEREAKAGFTEFILSGEITRYDGANYLLIRKLLRRMDDDNVRP